METRRPHTRIVKLPGLPEIMRRNNATARIIDATVEPRPPRISERSSLFQNTGTTAVSATIRSANHVKSPPPHISPPRIPPPGNPPVASRFISDAIPRIRRTTTTIKESASSRNSMPNISPQKFPTPQRRATSASPAAVPPAEWLETVMETVEQLKGSLSVIMQEIKSINEKIDNQDHNTQERILKNEEQIESLNKSLEDIRHHNLSQPTNSTAQQINHQYLPQQKPTNYQNQNLQQPKVFVSQPYTLTSLPKASNVQNHNYFRTRYSRPSNETAFTTYGDTRHRTDTPLSARLKEFESPVETQLDVSMASREYLYRHNILN